MPALDQADVEPPRRHALWLLGIGVVWVALLGSGFAFMWAQEGGAGRAGAAPKQWPSTSSLVRDEGRAKIVMFAHPRCPCTRSSLAELAKLLLEVPGMRADVVFMKPDGESDSFATTGLYERATSLPGVRVSIDTGARESTRFGALTSGHTVVYDAAGKLVYAGGITMARGHEGDNAGRRRIRELLTVGRTDAPAGPTFGCELSDSEPVARRDERGAR